MKQPRLFLLGIPVFTSLLMGAQGDGCAASSKSPAPDVTGTWDVSYDDLIGVEITIGGAVYTAELGAQGGAVTIDHDGQPFTFDLDCDRPDVLCPSEAWPREVTAEQRDLAFEHRMIVTLPVQRCSGALVAPQAGSCGAGTTNPDCDQVCDGEVTVTPTETFGVIGESGETFLRDDRVVGRGRRIRHDRQRRDRRLGGDRDGRRPGHDRLRRRLPVGRRSRHGRRPRGARPRRHHQVHDRVHRREAVIIAAP
jgi:hypothetical protein